MAYAVVLPRDLERDATIGQKLRALRKEKHLSQKALAEACDISWRGLAELEADKLQGMQTRHVKRVCEYLDISADWLLNIKAPSRGGYR